MFGALVTQGGSSMGGTPAGFSSGLGGGGSNVSYNTYQAPVASGWQNFGAAAQGIGSLAGAFMGYKNYQLAKDQMDMQNKYNAANLWNQGEMANYNIGQAQNIAKAGSGQSWSALEAPELRQSV